MADRRVIKKKEYHKDLNAMAAALKEGKSALDLMDDDDDDDRVYDLVDDETYEKIQAERLQGGDFVVDDEGIHSVVFNIINIIT